MDFALGLLIFGWIFVAIWIPVVIFSQRKYHPRALFTLFFAELWERFSFYGMRALLTLYMVKILFENMGDGEADVRALGIYGAYGAMVYLAPVIGGLIADRILGFRKAVLLGGIFMAMGHFVLAIEGSQLLFFASLGFIIVGNGFFKPNISSFLGTFYEQNDPRKDGAFTIFYMGVNIGAFLAPLTCGYLGEKVDWSLGFGIAGIGMLVGLVVFWQNMKHFQGKGLSPIPEKLKEKTAIGLPLEWTVVLGCFLAIPVFALMLDKNEFTGPILFILGAGILIYLLVTSLRSEDKKEGQRLLVVIVLFFFHMIFWALFEQAGGSLTLFADRVVDRNFLGTEIPASQFASLNPLFIMLLAPVFSWIWVKLSQAKREPATPMKFFLGLLLLGVGYLILVLGARLFSDQSIVPLGFLILMYLFHTMGELSLSPVGLSMVTKLSPKKVVGFVMGFWFLSISFAHELAGQLGKLATVPVENASASDILNGFTDVYMTWGVYGVGAAALILLVLVPTLKKWMNGIH